MKMIEWCLCVHVFNCIILADTTYIAGETFLVIFSIDFKNDPGLGWVAIIQLWSSWRFKLYLVLVWSGS